MLERPFETLTVLLAVLAGLLVLLGVAIHALERRAADRAGRPGAGLEAGAERAGRPARHPHLSRQELERLWAWRSRARLMAGEPLAGPGWWGQVRHAWREGYSGWVIACLVGSFSMATHFGAWWLIAGGGWAGAVLVTLFSTFVMVSTCAWIGLGLLRGR